MPALGHLDGVDLADQVGDGDVRGGQLFRIAQVPADPGHGGCVAHVGHRLPGVRAEGIVGVVVEFAAGDDRDLIVQQVDHLPDQAGLGLPALAQQDDVLAGQDGVFQLGNDRLVEADDAGKHRLLGAYLGDQVPAHLLAHRNRLVTAIAEFADGGGQSVIRGHGIGPSFGQGRVPPAV